MPDLRARPGTGVIVVINILAVMNLLSHKAQVCLDVFSQVRQIAAAAGCWVLSYQGKLKQPASAPNIASLPIIHYC